VCLPLEIRAGSSGRSRIEKEFVADSLEHGRCRVLPESLLRAAHNGVAKPGQKVVRSGKGQDVVPHAVVALVPLDQESFFTTLDVAGREDRLQAVKHLS
jgi:hypothetical protein